MTYKLFLIYKLKTNKNINNKINNNFYINL